MKRTDLAKSLGLKIKGQMQQAPAPNRFGTDAPPDRREQRKLDQAAGLVPFAVKLHHELVRRLQASAVAQGLGLNELTARVLEAGLGLLPNGAAGGQHEAAAAAPSATAPVVKKAVVAGAAGAKKATTRKGAAKEAPVKKAPAKKAAADAAVKKATAGKTAAVKKAAAKSRPV